MNPQIFAPSAEWLMPGPSHGLFDGDSKHYSKRQTTAVLKALASAQPVLQSMLAQGEEVGFACVGVGYPRMFDQMGLGAWWTAYHRVLLVFTPKRIIELELTSGNERASRVRTLPWSAIATLKYRKMIVQTLTITTRDPKKTLRFNIDPGGAEVLKNLVAVWTERMATSVPEPVKLAKDGWQWHCTACFAPIDEKAKQCPSCQAEYRSTGKGVLLALAFPGAGVWYAKRRLLAVLDFLGEAFIFLIGFLGAAQGNFEMLFIFLLLLFFTKLESAHLSEVFLRRKLLITPAEKSRSTVALLLGGFLSVLAFCAILVLSMGTSVIRKEMEDAIAAGDLETALQKADSLTEEDQITVLDQLAKKEIEEEGGAQKALTHLDRLEQLLSEQKPDDAEGKHTTAVSRAYVLFRRGLALKTLEDPKSANTSYQQGIKALQPIARSKDEQAELADAHYASGALYGETGEWGLAKREFTLANDEFTKCKGAKSLEAIESRHMLAVALHEAKDDAKAKDTFKQVLADATELPDENADYRTGLNAEFAQRFPRK